MHCAMTRGIAAILALGLISLAHPALAKPAVCKPKQLDLSLPVAGHDLFTEAGVRKLIGTDYKRLDVNRDTDFPWAVFVSTDGTQSLALMSHPGGTQYDYQEFEIKYLSLSKNDVLGERVAYYIGHEIRDQTLPTKAFATGRGIRLGVSRDVVTARLGPCKRIFKRCGDMETIRYVLEGENHPLLKKHGMPSTYAEYQFQRRKLVRFRFGFDYP